MVKDLLHNKISNIRCVVGWGVGGAAGSSVCRLGFPAFAWGYGALACAVCRTFRQALGEKNVSMGFHFFQVLSPWHTNAQANAPYPQAKAGNPRRQTLEPTE